MRHMPRRPNTPQSVVGRVLAIFECFAEDSKPLSLNEISHNSGFPLSTTYRLVRELHSGERSSATTSDATESVPGSKFSPPSSTDSPSHIVRTPGGGAAGSSCRRISPDLMRPLLVAANGAVDLAGSLVFALLRPHPPLC